MPTQNKRHREAKQELARARAAYHELASDPDAPQGKLAAASDLIKRASAEVAAAIVQGAEVCPGCGQVPHGIEQPGRKGSSEYEIGCLSCRPFDHDDGTRREYRVRGGLLPSHAVDAWNAGPDFWLQEVPKEVKDASVPEKEPAE